MSKVKVRKSFNPESFQAVEKSCLTAYFIYTYINFPLPLSGITTTLRQPVTAFIFRRTNKCHDSPVHIRPRIDIKKPDTIDLFNSISDLFIKRIVFSFREIRNVLNQLFVHPVPRRLVV
ncbi:hypothetical protein ACFL6I_03285 [candidate division KSB1 bacterium]